MRREGVLWQGWVIGTGHYVLIDRVRGWMEIDRTNVDNSWDTRKVCKVIFGLSNGQREKNYRERFGRRTLSLIDAPVNKSERNSWLVVQLISRFIMCSYRWE